MGYIDADAHVRETDDTWSYLSEAEAKFRPLTLVSQDGAMGTAAGNPSPDVSRFWAVQDQRIPRKDGIYARERERELFPIGTVEMTDVATRLRHMDELGVDVQVLFSTFWIAMWFSHPLADRALSRSFNRWMAEATAPSGGRLRWVLKPPTTSIDVALEELEFGAEHGAAAVWMRGTEHGLDVGDPYYWPLYERAQDLGLAMAVHTGHSSTSSARIIGPNLFRMTESVLEACYSVLKGDLPDRFPRLRWGFFEAGAGWAPWLVQNSIRSDEFSLRDERLLDWRAASRGILAERGMYVSVFADDDLGYLADTVGDDCLVLGSDWGHYDAGSDPAAHRTVAARTDVDEVTRRRIVDTNARRLFGIAEDFQPAAAALAST